MEKVYSCYYYPYEYHNPHVHLEFNNNKSSLNEAEAKALQQIEKRNRNVELKKLRQKEFIKKYNKSALLYEEEQRMKNKEEQLLKKKEQDEQILRIQNYNKTVYQNNMKPFLKEKEKARTIVRENNNRNKKKNLKKNLNDKKVKSKEKKEQKDKSADNKKRIEIKDNLDIETKEILDNLAENDIKNKSDNNKNLYNKDNFNSNKEIDLNNLNNNNNNVIDLRNGLENQVLEEIKLKNIISKNNEISDKVDNKISTLKNFRTFGLLPEEYTKGKKKENKNKKFSSEFERRRFIKSLKNIITEKLGENKIILDNICSCGNLQKQLNSLIEKDNLKEYILNDVECLNNCVFYNNKIAYLEKINEVLKSIKELYLENNIKYKEKK